MIDYYQETDSKVIFALPYELSTYSEITSGFGSSSSSEKYEARTEQLLTYPPSTEPSNETTGGSLIRCFFPIPEDSSLVRGAWDTIHQTENQQVAQEARRLLSIIQEMIASFQRFRFDLGYLPPLQAFNVDDGSVLIEWIFSDFRIGFSIEPNPEDSGWYLVSNKNLGEISASGYTSNIDIKTLVLWLLNFALSNS